MLMIDPKMVELERLRSSLPHLMHPVVTDMKKAEAILGLGRRQNGRALRSLLARAGVRHVTVYNQLGEEELRERIQPTSEAEWEDDSASQLPFIVIVADEMADLMMTAGKDVEQHIIRLAQKSRAVGIHLILGHAKTDSGRHHRPDQIELAGTDRLPSGQPRPTAAWCWTRRAPTSCSATATCCSFRPAPVNAAARSRHVLVRRRNHPMWSIATVGTGRAPVRLVNSSKLKTKEEESKPPHLGRLKNRDELYEPAIEVVVREQRGSVSLLQRCLGIGYGRAARLIDFMAEDGIVGQYNGSQAREVTITMAEWETMRDGGEPEPTAETPQPKRTNRIEFDSTEEDEPAPWEDDTAEGDADVESEEAYEEEDYKDAEEEQYEEEEEYDEEDGDEWEEEDATDEEPEEWDSDEGEDEEWDEADEEEEWDEEESLTG